MDRAPHTHTGSFEISCGLPQAEWLPSAAALGALGGQGDLSAPAAPGLGRPPARSQAVNHSQRSQLRPRRPPAGAGQRAGGGTCGRDPRRLSRLGCQARGPAIISAVIPLTVVPVAAAPQARPRQLARRARLTEEALHDAEGVAQPVFSTGHGAESRGQRGPCGASPWAERARNPAAPRGLVSTLPRARRREPRTSGRLCRGDESLGAAGPRQEQHGGPHLHFSQWREIAATDRAASDLGGVREGGAAGTCCAVPEGREWAGRAAILETGKDRAVAQPPS